MQIVAGFECAYLPWNGHDLLHSTQHTPETKMGQHYDVALDHGIVMARDGVSPNHNLAARFMQTRLPNLLVVWDLLHYHMLTESPFDYGIRVGKAWKAVNGDVPFFCCPQNEPTLAPLMTGKTLAEAVAEGHALLEGVRSILSQVFVFHVDVPRAENWFNSTIHGINIYPHTLKEPIRDIIKEAQDRTGNLVWISETSWHDGYHEWENIHNKAEWLNFIAGECEAEGVQSICWYPFVDSPPWDHNEGHDRWSHGLIHHDLSLDEGLSSWIKKQPSTPT